MTPVNQTISNNNFIVKLECAGIESDLLDAFATHCNEIDFSPMNVTITLHESGDGIVHKLIDSLYKHSLTKPEISQITGQMIPPAGNAEITVTVLDENNNELFTDITKNQFLVNHQYHLKHMLMNEAVVYKLTFMTPQSAMMKPMI